MLENKKSLLPRGERLFREARTNVGSYTPPHLHSHTCMKCCFVCEHVSTMSLPNGEPYDLLSKISVWSGKGQGKDDGNQSRLHAVRQYVMWNLASSWLWWLHHMWDLGDYASCRRIGGQKYSPYCKHATLQSLAQGEVSTRPSGGLLCSRWAQKASDYQASGPRRIAIPEKSEKESPRWGDYADLQVETSKSSSRKD